MNASPAEPRGRFLGAARVRHAALVLAAVVTLDLSWVLLTRTSLLSPAAVTSGGAFVWRVLALGALLAGAQLLRPPPAGSVLAARGVLVAGLLASLCQFHFTGPRVVGDGMMYYVYVRSLWKDCDLDFANEYGHYGLLRPDRGDLTTLTSTGMRRSIFSIGPAVLWSPFFGVGEAVARTQRLLGIDADLSGYGPIHWNAVALGSLLYGFLTVVSVYAFLRRHFAPGVALLAATLMWGATFLHWYMVDQPTYAHAGSAFLAALAVWLWDRGREGRTLAGYAVWGLCLGLAMCVRWQNSVLLVLPGLELLLWLKREPRAWQSAIVSGAVLGATVFVGAFPQMAAWKVLFGEWLLRYPPHGAGFVRLDHPFLMETFFSSRHGLLSWTPVLWLGFVGFIPACRRRLAVAAPLALALGVMSYVNVCAGDWWAGASFSNRRFDSTLPLLALGMAASLEWLREANERRPLLAVSLLLAPLVVWNVCNVALRERGPAGRAETLTFAEQVRRNADLVARKVGSPPTWPASWIFAWQHGVGPEKYDGVAGRYLFYRQNNLGGHIDIGAPGDEVMLGEGWDAARIDQGVSLRALSGRARIFAPLDVPEALRVRLHARGEDACALVLSVNGSEIGGVAATREWGAQELLAPAAVWRRETNDVWLETNGCPVQVDAVDFERVTTS
jgi:hypothetical protein